MNAWAHEGARDVWQRMAAAAGPADAGPEKVFLSRTVFNEAQRAEGRAVRTDAERDSALDRVFAEAGFVVITPEALPIRDQIRVAAAAKVLAGSAGTALHLSAFAPAGTRVIEVGDSRSQDVQVPGQLVIDHLCEHPSAFIPYRVPPSDIPDVLQALGCAAP